MQNKFKIKSSSNSYFIIKRYIHKLFLKNIYLLIFFLNNLLIHMIISLNLSKYAKLVDIR